MAASPPTPWRPARVVAAVATATAVAVALSQLVAGAPATPAVDGTAHRATLLSLVAKWNRGALTAASRSGTPTPYHVSMGGDWAPIEPADTTVIAQARGVVMNAVATSVAAAAGDPRARAFAAATKAGVDALMALYRGADEGFAFLVDSQTRTVSDATRDAFGQAEVVKALAAAAKVLDGVDAARALAAASATLAYVHRKFEDGTGGYYRTAGDAANATRAIEPVSHFFDAQLSLYGALPDGSAQKAALAADAGRVGTFLAKRLPVPADGDATASYVCRNFEPTWTCAAGAWTPASQWHTAGWASNGHGLSVALALYRAAAAGVEPAGGGWTATADRLVRFAETTGVDVAGYLRWDAVALDGTPFTGNADNERYLWAANAMLGRVYLHRWAVRGLAADKIKWERLRDLMGGPFTDGGHGGGWFRALTVDGLASDGSAKWNRWKVPSGFALFHEAAIAAAAM